MNCESVETIAADILEMMAEKTKLYGGMNAGVETDFVDKLLCLHYEGVNRKSRRLPTLVKRIVESPDDPVAKAQYLDTLVDIVGYCLLTIKEIGEECED